MLDPNDRLTLVEMLRPPDGYELGYALGTSFTLDLISALVCPLSFAMFDWEDADGKPKVDPHALLEALRRYADRLSIFCQAGQISVPPAGQALLPYMERAIVEANAPKLGHIFHPKLWVLRFEAPDEDILYRVLCLTRNLTFDRCWDAAVVLEGAYAGRDLAVASSHPLADFIAGLPALARDRLDGRVIDEVARIEREVRRTSFQPPPSFEEVVFWPLGIRGHEAWPFDTRIDRMMVISPYLQPRALARLTEEGRNNIIVSRVESLQQLSKDELGGFTDLFVLSEGADVEAQGQPEDAVPQAAPAENLLRGLHAKIFVADAGWNASIWTGSANATNAAFEGNVEFLVELRGTKPRCGIDAILGTDDKPGLQSLLQRFEPDAPVVDEVAEALQRRADDVRYALGQTPLLARVLEDEGEDLYTVRVERVAEGAFKLPTDAEVRCWPARQAEGSAVTITDEGSALAVFSNIAVSALTSFFVFEVTVAEGRRKWSIRFTLNVPLDGAPADRFDRILAEMLKDKDQVLRFLLFLLGDAESDPENSMLIVDLLGSNSDSATGLSELPLLEAMVRTLARSPERLDNVARLIESLQKTPEGMARIPDGFLEIWEPIWQVRAEVHRG